MNVKAVKKSEPKLIERNTMENFETAKMIAATLSPCSETFFELLVEFSIGEGLTCGDCYGFQCSKCWRGVIVAYAIQNTRFFEWLHDNKERSGVEYILKGITQINNQ